MEKSLYQAPQGLESLDEAPDLEIEIVDPEAILEADSEEENG